MEAVRALPEDVQRKCDGRKNEARDTLLSMAMGEEGSAALGSDGRVLGVTGRDAVAFL